MQTTTESRCIRCGRIVPEGEYQCVACSEYDDTMVYRMRVDHKPEPALKYFRIADECGWTYYVATDNLKLNEKAVLLVPHVRSAREITRQEYERRTLC